MRDLQPVLLPCLICYNNPTAPGSKEVLTLQLDRRQGFANLRTQRKARRTGADLYAIDRLVHRERFGMGKKRRRRGQVQLIMDTFIGPDTGLKINADPLDTSIIPASKDPTL